MDLKGYNLGLVWIAMRERVSALENDLRKYKSMQYDPTLVDLTEKMLFDNRACFQVVDAEVSRLAGWAGK